MPNVTAKPSTASLGSVLANHFSKAHGLAKADAYLSAVLCGGATCRLIAQLGNGGIKAIIWGSLVAIGAYIAIAPKSTITACLVSARKCFLDNLVTCSECREMRRKCLRKSLLY
jgi:hypothetical protein